MLADTEPLEPASWLEAADRECFLCRAAAKFDDETEANRLNLVVQRGQQCVVMLNRFPYANGHLLVAPLRHAGQLHELSPDEHLEALEALGHYTQLLTKVIKANGFNIGLNLGQVAGAGVPGHLHWHLVPRWTGDHNFMPTLAGTRVIPQSLEAVWDALMENRAD